jgi:hypothetical protein
MVSLAHVIEGNHEEGLAWEPVGVEAPEWSVSQGLLNNGVKGGPYFFPGLSAGEEYGKEADI